MFCAISGSAPEKPVISIKSGHLFEQSVIEKYIDSTGKCPVTGAPLEPSDLLPLKVSATVKPRSQAAASVPGMLTLFQNEWDALMLETYTLKQQLETVRQELGHALYQHDAACRVIARLVKERDDARKALADAQPATSSAPAVSRATAPPVPVSATTDGAMEVEDSATGLTPEIVAKFDTTSKKLAKGRKKRQPPADQTSSEALGSFRLLTSEKLHTAGPVCIDVHASEPLAVSGGSDGSIILFDCQKGKPQRAPLLGHSKQVTCVRLHPTKPMALSCSQDTTVRCWSTTTGEQTHVLGSHTSEVTACSLHATGDYGVTASLDKSWVLFDLERGKSILRVADGAAGYTCAGFHPDGLILGTGTNSEVHIWDVKTQKDLACFEGHSDKVSCLAFSENGYYLATGAADKTVKLWDLRKLQNFHTISTPATVGALHFDYSGQYLSVGSSDISVYESKTWSNVKTFSEQLSSVTGVCFGRAAATLAGSTADGMLKLYGSS